MISLETPVGSAPKISKKILPALKRLGIATLRDLLFHFPSRYEEFPEEQAIADVATGERATITGVVQKISERRTAKGMRMTEATMRDESAAINVIWFNQAFLARTLKEGDVLRLSGKIARGLRGLSLQNPSYEKITNHRSQIISSRGIHTGGLVPVYPETEGITSRWLRFLIRTYLPLRASIKDPLPDETRARHNLPKITDALIHIHFPDSKEQATAAEHRFIFEELMLVQLRALRERSRQRARAAAAIPFDLALVKSFVGSLAFQLTDAQRRAIWEIGRDMAREHPMNRLLEGDVGSGKTVVAAAAALLAMRAGLRVAYMAPTEILARQHFTTFARILAPFRVGIGLRTAAEKKSVGASDIVIGTHALLYPVRGPRQRRGSPDAASELASNGVRKNAMLENLGLVIVDEQHRFGVHQRAMLLKQKTVPHFLSMTATPIPRTLALTIYGDLDLSLLDEMPKNRKSVVTKIIPASQRADAYRFIREEVGRGRQVFVICPRIEVTEKKQNGSIRTSRAYQQKLLTAEVKTVTEEYKKLSEFIFPDIRIAMLHGKMKAKDKTATMKMFRDRGTDILVSTSVIEVGVDVPNATIMMIEGAERFGLAQLHQFRGRVGRGADQSYCFLFPTEDGPIARRLRAIVEAKNGFELAEKDLAIRGPGDLFGDRQWGEPGLVLKGITDARLVRTIREEAMVLAQQSPDLAQYPALAARLAALEQTLHLE